MGHKSYSMVALLTTQVANLTDALIVSQEINQRQIDQMDGFQQELFAMEANHDSHLEHSREQKQIIEAQKEIVAEHQQRFLDLEAKLKNTQFELSSMTDQCLANDDHAAMEYTPPTAEEEINCATEMTKRLVSLEILQHLKKKNISPRYRLHRPKCNRRPCRSAGSNWFSGIRVDAQYPRCSHGPCRAYCSCDSYWYSRTFKNTEKINIILPR